MEPFPNFSQRISRALSTENFFNLVGEQGFGKTFLLAQIYNLILSKSNDSGNIYLPLPLAKIRQIDKGIGFKETLLFALGFQPSLHPISDITSPYAYHCGQIVDALSSANGRSKLAENRKNGVDNLLEQLLKDTLPHRSLFLFIDTDEETASFSPNDLIFLSQIYMRYRRLALAITSQDRIAYSLEGDPTSPLSEKIRTFYIGSASDVIIDEIVENSAVKMDDKSRAVLLRQSGRNPYLLKIILSAWRDVYFQFGNNPHSSGDGPLEIKGASSKFSDMLNEVEKITLAHPSLSLYADKLIERWRRRPQEWSILHALVINVPAEMNYSESLQNLRNRGLIEKSTDGLDRFFSDDIASFIKQKTSNPPSGRRNAISAIKLSKKEDLILAYLMSHPGQVYKTDDMARELGNVKPASLQRSIIRLKKSLKDKNANVEIVNKHGKGYLLRLNS